MITKLVFLKVKADGGRVPRVNVVDTAVIDERLRVGKPIRDQLRDKGGVHLHRLGRVRRSRHKNSLLSHAAHAGLFGGPRARGLGSIVVVGVVHGAALIEREV
ncbi:MAG: hypothetical protein CL844_06540 [Crocinitomicaceae bacterium]|nr:hypothetical protein [Crocinitomicaceae bacterium]